MSEAPKTVWVAKDALTIGLKERPVIRDDGDGAWINYPSGPSYGVFVGSKYLHPTREAALARAEEMRAAKIASLRRQIERLESLEF